VTEAATFMSADEVDQVVERARRRARDGRLRSPVLRRLSSLYGLDGNEVEAAVIRLRDIGVEVEGDLDEVADTDEEPPAPPVAAVPASARSPLQDCIDRASALLVDRTTGQTPRKRVLSADEEVGLAALIRGEAFPLSAPLPPGYRAGLEPGSRAAQAFDALVEHNVRLVWSIARGQGRHGMDLEDIASSGMFGLLRAVEMFDGTRGFKFSTYATGWIRQTIGRAVANEAATIRLPVHLVDQVNRMRAVWSRLEARTPGEVRLSAVARELDVPVSKVVELLQVSRGTFSLDKPLVADASLTLRDVLPAGGDLEEAHEQSEAAAAIAAALATLSEREAHVVRLRFGIGSGEGLTLAEIGDQFGLTRERIRQIQEKALKKLRHPTRARSLEIFYGGP
jgi:RNA polymerase primary sigma factor